ncbi:hypothetical protein CTA2_10931 [Colletotrichum tanaceti]|uniref:Cell wall mannoprotein 1 n=1 Tax=Colletotrichum tanaceti TaxID=1306861 RepID=A0A4U6X500_9PEZI|nr:hypothetical protein CTA2_10931 [Colletotrichum tanaceti]TKW50265.1 hypothetical protein CTA1_9219 [Colletotrichum tanaceti]
MQAKVLTAVLATLSFTAEAAVLPRATITPGQIVLPEVVFNPSELLDPAYAALMILRTDIAKTTTLVGDLTRTTGTTIKDRTDQMNAVIRQVTSNTNSIRTRVGTIVGGLMGMAPSGIPAPTGTSSSTAQHSVPSAEVIQVAQDVVRQAQTLARAATSQLQNLQTQTSAVNDAVGKAAFNLAYTQASLAFQVALSTVGAAAGVAIDAVANSVDNVDGLIDRIRNVKARLNPVLVIGVTPDVTF